MKRTISVALGTLALLGAVAFGGFAGSASASEHHDRNREANWRHHRHHHKHHGRRVPRSASLRKQSW